MHSLLEKARYSFSLKRKGWMGDKFPLLYVLPSFCCFSFPLHSLSHFKGKEDFKRPRLWGRTRATTFQTNRQSAQDFRLFHRFYTRRNSPINFKPIWANGAFFSRHPLSQSFYDLSTSMAYEVRPIWSLSWSLIVPRNECTQHLHLGRWQTPDRKLS